jgi:glutathione S-transferase
MKIYESTTAPNPRRVRIFLAEKGLKIPYEQVDLVAAVNRGPEFRKKNPLGGVPVLELDDGSYIAESVAICRYFEGVNPEPALFGKGAQEQAVVEMWNRRMELGLFGPCTDAFRHRHEFFKGKIAQVPEYAEARRQEAERALTWIDSELVNRHFIAGDKYSIADITALCAIDFGRVSKIKIAPEQKNLARWHEEVSARPSAKA